MQLKHNICFSIISYHPELAHTPFTYHVIAILVHAMVTAFFFSFIHKITAHSILFQTFMAPMKLASLTSITHLVQSHGFLYLFVPPGVSPTVHEIHQLGFQLLCKLYVL